MKDCPICNDWCGPKSEEISKRRAARTAHELASKKADEGISGLKWEEVYTVYFPKIYKHEFERNHKLERELELYESIKKNLKHPDVCYYHYESVMWYMDGTQKDTLKGVRREYAQTKWPNGVKSGY